MTYYTNVDFNYISTINTKQLINIPIYEDDIITSYENKYIIIFIKVMMQARFRGEQWSHKFKL